MPEEPRVRESKTTRHHTPNNVRMTSKPAEWKANQSGWHLCANQQKYVCFSSLLYFILAHYVPLHQVLLFPAEDWRNCRFFTCQPSSWENLIMYFLWKEILPHSNATSSSLCIRLGRRWTRLYMNTGFVRVELLRYDEKKWWTCY